jgi:16S rRNA (guanine966-N2)-methyltransferase
MRIISGKLKGKLIKFLKNEKTRPLKDSVKENIFNILKHSNLVNIKIEEANILDLYSGVGSFGLECISRGARKVTFVDQDKDATNILKENVKTLSVISKTSIITDKIENFLINEKEKKFNLFFLDPPFLDDQFIQNLDLISKNKIYENKHIVVIHREKKSRDNLGKYIRTVITKEYGRSKIIFGFFIK